MIANPNIGPQLEMSSGIAKRSMSLLGAGAVTMGLLFMMTQLINNDMPVIEEERSIDIPQFSFIETDETPVIVEIVKPEIQEPPAAGRIEYASDLTISPDNIQLPMAEFEGPKDIQMQGLPGGMALVPISPQYPESAARRGLCGHVVVQYDISADGIPMNVSVIGSSSRLFNKNAVRAVQRARYKPHVEGGKPAVVYGKQEKISFQLEGGC